MLEQYKQDFIKLMVNSGVLTFGDFTLKSGRKSPYFINTGNYKTGKQLNKFGEFYAERINKVLTLKGPNQPVGGTVLFGPAYKGIPLCAVTASALARLYDADVGYCFNRKEAKDHGEGGSFVGSQLQDGNRVVLIEDVITAGTAVREIYPLIKAAAEVNITDMFISVDRMEKGQKGITASNEIFAEFNIVVYSIVTVYDIMEYLHNTEIDGKVYVDDRIYDRMTAYMEEYCV